MRSAQSRYATVGATHEQRVESAVLIAVLGHVRLGLTLEILCDHFDKTKLEMLRVVTRCEQAGLVQRRSQRYRLTDEGRGMLATSTTEGGSMAEEEGEKQMVETGDEQGDGTAADEGGTSVEVNVNEGDKASQEQPSESSEDDGA